MRRSWQISRRTCLKGIGAAIGLPLLETMGWADPPKGGAYRPTVRLGFMYHPCGIWPADFWPTNAAAYPAVLPPNLEPLRPVIDQCLLIDGLRGPPTSGHYPPHARELSAWLTASLYKLEDRTKIDIAPSADQVAAQHIGLYTVVPSLELGFRDNAATGLGEDGVTNRYYTTGNFRSATQPLPLEISPAAVYKRLFSSRQSVRRKKGGPDIDPAKFVNGEAAPAAEESLDRSMLDIVWGGAKDLRGRVSVDDGRRLDDYLDTLRSLEQRITAIERQQAETARNQVAAKGAKAKPQVSSPLIEVTIPAGTPAWSEHIKLMGDLMILAFQADLTRVCTLIGSHVHAVSYPEIDINDSHHDLSHTEKNADKIAKLTRVDHFAIEQFAYIVGRMKSLREGPGTLLDNCIMTWGSGMDHGDHHFDRLPTIVAGKGGGTIRTGRYVTCAAGANNGDLLTGLLARAGVPMDKPFGCGTKMLAELA